MNVDYIEVLNHCDKMDFSFYKLQQYIYNNSNWECILLMRHHKYAKEILNGSEIIQLSNKFEFGVETFNNILKKMQAQFEIYEKYKKDYKSVMIVDSLCESDILKRIAIKNKCIRDMEKDIYIKPIDLNKLNPGIKNEYKNNGLKIVLQKISVIENIEEIFGEKLSIYIEDLLNGQTIEEVCKNRGRNYKYLLEVFVGRNNPRNNMEKGIEVLLNEFDPLKIIKKKKK